MSDTQMPEPSNEWLSAEGHQPYPKIMAILVRNFSMRLKHAATLGALDNIRRDVLRSPLIANVQAIQEVRGIANERAIELKYKDPKGKEWWE